MNENQIKSIYLANAKRLTSTNGNQAPIITTKDLIMFATIAEIIKENKAASESAI